MSSDKSDTDDRGTMSFEYSNGQFRSNYVEINPANTSNDNIVDGEVTNSTQMNGEMQDDAKSRKEKKLKKEKKHKKEKKDKKSKQRRERSSSTLNLDNSNLDDNNNNTINNNNGSNYVDNPPPVKPNKKETQTRKDDSDTETYAFNFPGSRASWKHTNFTLEDDPHKLADCNGIVNLNVGGTFYATTIETLKSDPGSMLSAMFSGVYKLRKDKNDAYFIDRDGHNFRYILNYLRDGTVDLMQEEFQLKQLLREAQYYQVGGLIRIIEESIKAIYDQQEKENKGQYAVVYLGGYGKQAQDTGGGFSESCVTLNKLAAEGYHIEGVASGANGHYYAILRTKETDKSIFQKTTY